MIKVKRKFLAFATLPFFIFVILFFLVFINSVYTKNESLIDKTQVFQAAIKRAELEETIRKAGEEVVEAYKEAKQIKQELVKADELAGWPVLKILMVVNIGKAMDDYLKIESKINTTCFCSFYDYNELKQSSDESSNKSMITIPRNAKVGMNCNEYIDIFITSLENISIVLTKNNVRFFCIAQNKNSAYIETLRQEITLRETMPKRNDLLNVLLNELENKYGKSMQ
ncbi:MAG: hypothetical protein QXI89_00880 [Candidatus Anstonellales archaeon]